MNELDEISNLVPDGVYLSFCNTLKEVHKLRAVLCDSCPSRRTNRLIRRWYRDIAKQVQHEIEPSLRTIKRAIRKVKRHDQALRTTQA